MTLTWDGNLEWRRFFEVILHFIIFKSEVIWPIMILIDIIEACGAVFLCSSAEYFSF